MIALSRQEFEALVSQAIDDIPNKYYSRIKNVAFVVEDYPTPEQRKKLHLHKGQLLFGLYEGIPLTSRTAGYNIVLPDKITLFQKALEQVCQTRQELSEQVRYTVWHEVAHYFGLNHDRIHDLESKPSKRGNGH